MRAAPAAPAALTVEPAGDALAPARSAPVGAAEAPAGQTSPYDDDPWPEPDDLVPPYDDAPVEPFPAPPAAPAATAPASPAPSGPASASVASSDQPAHDKWAGLGVGGGTVRAHWETDEDDAAETVRVVVEAPPPPPPPPPRKATNGTGAAAADAPPATTVPGPAQPTAPAFDFQELRQRWPALRDQLWPNPIERAQFHSCELVGVEGACLVIQMSSGNLLLLKDEKKRAIRGDLIRLLGKGTDVRFIDDKTAYAPPAAAATGSPAVPPLPTGDPVIQAGLRLFGGPLERLPDE